MRIEERQNPRVELARTSRRHHVLIAQVVVYRSVLIESIADVVVGDNVTPAEIVEAVGAVATAGILEFAWRVHQRGLDALGLMIARRVSRIRHGSLLSIVRIKVLERAGLVVHHALVVILVIVIPVAILVRSMRVVCVVGGDTGGEARRRRPVVILIVLAVLAVLVVALIRFREVGRRGGGRYARTRRVLR